MRAVFTAELKINKKRKKEKSNEEIPLRRYNGRTKTIIFETESKRIDSLSGKIVMQFSSRYERIFFFHP